MARKKSIPDPAFTARMQEIVDQVGGQNAFSRLSGIPQATISIYCKGGEPSRAQLVIIARAANRSIEWLATGDEEQSSNNVSAIPPDILEAVKDERVQEIVRSIVKNLYPSSGDQTTQQRKG